MTIVQKAQRFDEAIERARKELQICGSQDCDAARQIFRFFPELAESEDEKMVKFIKNQLFNIKKTITENYELDVKLTKAIDWLEKQGEQSLAFIEKGKWYVCIRTSYKPNGKDFIEGKTYYAKEDYKIIGECGEVDIATDNPEEFFRSATEEETNDIIKNFVNEQKPAWSEEDENNLHYWLDNNKSIGNDKYKWLKSLKDRVQPKQEWSEEDIKMIDWLIRCCEKEHEELCNDKYGHQDIVSDLKRDCRKKWDWLESLKNRVAPQKQWKPSEEQMKALLSKLPVIKGGGDKVQDILESLYQDLKKLREE